MSSICVIGMWHLGCTTAACLAELGNVVVGFDRDLETVARLAAGEPPLFEPGLAELVTRELSAGRLRFSSDLREAVALADYVWLAADTPLDDLDQADLSDVFRVVREVAPALRSGATLLVSSQVPVGTCEHFQKIITDLNPRAGSYVAYIPENLRLGQALERFRHPAMLVIGADSEQARARTLELLSSISAPKLAVNLRSAEMTKHAINAFLATSISFANEIGNICDEVGADARAVARAMRMDERIGPNARLDPGLGFAGGTLARDLRVLQALGDQHDYDTALVDAVLTTNARQNGWVARMLTRMWGSLAGQTVGVFGLTYTPNTSTLRRSAALEIIRDLCAAGTSVTAYDPKADLGELREQTEFAFLADPYAAAAGRDCLVIATAWPEFRDLDYVRIRAMMRTPLVLDTRNMLDAEAMRALGFVYVGIGRGDHIRPEVAQ